MFSSFKHFQTSEDMDRDPLTVLLIIANVCFGLVYVVTYVIETIRSVLAFRRLQFSQKVGHVITMIMVVFTLLVLLAKFSRQGGFETQLTLTIIYNVYIWHLAFLYAPEFASKGAQRRGGQH